jgi:hypothetical protein
VKILIAAALAFSLFAACEDTRLGVAIKRVMDLPRILQAAHLEARP